MADLRYPIGEFRAPAAAGEAERQAWITDIEVTPEHLRAAVAGLDEEQLDTPYRPDGWTVRQVAHHLPDSHLNAYVRFKLTLTEDRPTIKTYDEARWAELADSWAPVDLSLELLEVLHRRWVLLLRSLAPEDWERTFHHPEMGNDLTLTTLLALYGWHGRHHVAHITELRRRRGW